MTMYYTGCFTLIRTITIHSLDYYSMDKTMADELNINKCVILTHSRFTYSLHHLSSSIILIKNHLFIQISTYINNVASNAMEFLNFVRQNLTKCQESVKSTVYLGLVWTKLEYASSVLDPYLSEYIWVIKGVQRIAVRWDKFNDNRENSVSCMLPELQWPTLLTRRLILTFNTAIILEILVYIYHNHHHLSPKLFPTFITFQCMYQQLELTTTTTAITKKLFETGAYYQLSLLRLPH